MTAARADEVRDERLAALLSALTDDLLAGRPAGIDRAVSDNPDLADDLRALWVAAEIADDVARSRGDSTSDPTGDYASPRRPFGSPADSPGDRVGDYLLHEEIGRGGMGVVYRAEHSLTNGPVAVKRLLRGASSSAEDQARFWSEVKAAGSLQHPNVVAVRHAGVHDGQPYLVMSLVEGTTLAKRLADGPLPSRDAARLLAPVARAVAHAHAHGVLHRDLKPSNILIDHDGNPLVSDFGLAKRVGAGESLTQSGAVLGTPSYMAPEQAAAGRGTVGPATDVYGLGAVLYQTLTGRPPFQAASP